MPSLENKHSSKLGFVSFFGNALEFFEFTVYGVFAPFFSKLFFPSGNELVSLLASWGAFAAAFFMRPVGALLFGVIGDRYGRKIALTNSILLMAMATLVIGLLPTYDTLGLCAPVLLLLCRLLQGLSTGGEYNGSALFLIEHFGEKRPGFIGGIITASCVVGAIIGTLVGKTCLSLGWNQAWRIPFLLGGLFGFLLFAMRYYLVESSSFESTLHTKKESFLPFIQAHPIKFLKNILVGGLNGALSYVLFGFSLLYLTRYKGLAMDEAFTLNIVGLLMFMMGNPVFGAFYDRLGGFRYLMLSCLWTTAFIFPANYFIMAEATSLNLLGMTLLGLLTASIAGPCHAYLQKDVPVSVRYRFVAVSFSIGMAVIGGLTPTFLTAIIETHHLMMSPALWIAGLSLLLFVMAAVFTERNHEPSLMSRSSRR